MEEQKKDDKKDTSIKENSDLKANEE